MGEDTKTKIDRNNDAKQTEKWSDKRIKTPLNACSLEVLQKGYSYNEKSDDGDDNDSVTHHPLIIGCYQLNENSNDKTTVEEDKEAFSEEEDDDEISTEKEVQTSSSTRSGALLLHMVEVPSTTTSKHLKFGDPEQILNTSSGILDGKWFQRAPIPFSTYDNNNINISSGYMYATACASGAIDIYRLLHKQQQKCQLDLIASSSPSFSHDHDNDHGLALSLAWDESVNVNHNDNEGTNSKMATRIVSSYSKGSIAIHNVNLTNVENIDNNHDNNDVSFMEETHRWDAHKLFGCAAEVWTVCFASNQLYSTYANTVISGGDDCKMKLWDLRTCSAVTNCSKPVHCIGDEEFSAGVTAVTYHPTLEHIFCSGSYDESIRLWDMRKLKSSEPVGRVAVGGGVWRIKWHPTKKGKILIAAMHGGCRIIDVPCLLNLDYENHNCSTSSYKMTIEKEFVEHKSMAYGADWIHLDGEYEGSASCSFYDQQAFIW